MRVRLVLFAAVSPVPWTVDLIHTGRNKWTPTSTFAALCFSEANSDVSPKMQEYYPSSL